MGVLDKLEPKRIFHFFEEISKIPRPSYKEKQISDYIKNFAIERGLEYIQDKSSNIIVIKEAAKGYENVDPIMLQVHIDMVCEKKPGVTKDMDKEGIDIDYDDKYIFAKGTTLGADDGIGDAIVLSLLDEKDLKAPRLEVVFTTSEEIGMEGATDIDISMLKARKLINVDSEEEGVFCVGCAGGSSTNIKYDAKIIEQTGNIIEIKYGGFTGGHSGQEITRQRANAIRAIGRVIAKAADKYDISIIEMSGGGKDNAIPRLSEAKILVKKEDEADVVSLISEEACDINNEYKVTDGEAEISITTVGEKKVKATTIIETKKVLSFILNTPNGILRMNVESEGIPETSLNLGVLEFKEGHLELVYAIRSSFESARCALENEMKLFAELMGGKLYVNCPYPAWEYSENSKLKEELVEIYKDMFGNEPKIQIIHAGLECGIMAGKIKGLDSISIGPNVLGAHTTEEKFEISSAKRLYEFLKKILEQK